MAFLDYNSTTPLDPRVRESMMPWLTDEWGNASTREYRLGWTAAEAVEEAREAVCDLIHTRSNTIVFTSGATESLSAVIRSFVGYSQWERCRIVTCATEHSAVLGPCEYLQKLTNIELSVLNVNSSGLLCLDDLRSEVETEKRCLVVVMAANNEVGTVQPIDEICRIAHEAGALFLCDLSQAVGKMPVDLIGSKFDYAAFSSHKIYGPKGAGALFIRTGADFEPLIVGGGQERGRRGGTLNVPAIVGFGRACRIAKDEMENDICRIELLRNKLEKNLLAELRGLWINGVDTQRLCNTSSIGFRGVDARTLIRDLHDIDCSTKSACSSGDAKPSHVLKALGLTDEAAYSCVRFSLGRFTSEQEIDYAIEKIVHFTQKLRRNTNYSSECPI